MKTTEAGKYEENTILSLKRNSQIEQKERLLRNLFMSARLF